MTLRRYRLKLVSLILFSISILSCFLNLILNLIFVDVDQVIVYEGNQCSWGKAQFHENCPYN